MFQYQSAHKDSNFDCHCIRVVSYNHLDDRPIIFQKTLLSNNFLFLFLAKLMPEIKISDAGRIRTLNDLSVARLEVWCIILSATAPFNKGCKKYFGSS